MNYFIVNIQPFPKRATFQINRENDITFNIDLKSVDERVELHSFYLPAILDSSFYFSCDEKYVKCLYKEFRAIKKLWEENSFHDFIEKLAKKHKCRKMQINVNGCMDYSNAVDFHPTVIRNELLELGFSVNKA